MSIKKSIISMSLALSMVLLGISTSSESVIAASVMNIVKQGKNTSPKTMKTSKSKGEKKMPEKAVDGSIIIHTNNFAAAYGSNIYYTLSRVILDDTKYNVIKRDMNTGKEVGIIENYATESMKVYGDYILCEETIGSDRFENTIYKIDKNMKRINLARGTSSVIVDNTIYYIAEKPNVDRGIKYLGLYKMNLNGNNKKLLKKGFNHDLGISGRNIYYYAKSAKTYNWFNLKTGKLEKNVVLSHLYDPISKTKVDYNVNSLKAAKYKNGKWSYKIIYKTKNTENGISKACVCGGKILLYVYDYLGKDKLFIMDINGKNIKLLHKGDAVG